MNALPPVRYRSPETPDGDGSAIAAAAIAWYSANARDLPWRRPGVSPWAILISEVMLQQTQVSRVEPVWTEWVDRWPAPADLAAESVGTAIRAWGRLGYPRRALRLHTCATAIVERHGGLVPDDVEALLALPGIGVYTARAVAAFAFGQRHPVVDTNVRRVVARAVAGVAEAGPATTISDLRATEALLPADPRTAATASVALMEIGALICTARAPGCQNCPLAATCIWWSTAAQLPSSGPAAPRRTAQRYAGSDRHVRGLILALLRQESTPVPAARIDLVWPDRDQRARALAGLVADGLVAQVTPRHYALPG